MKYEVNPQIDLLFGSRGGLRADIDGGDRSYFHIGQG
eukprot:CAMPEP_0113305784 /NCGR_PEP_ID=MMETSP0010_2-20120614/5285_1 /TAXON_ID=216773 ORGANISM="Corethron hystrix, Strain 308" /NCGR_SAMPLE_ID=MMETSP0010_2 /ASSEMBLY_ACC=CAM_ASM_000155 /LENGTH=36 /DNA_ID=CAMNT_0000160297 /DNA_START=927 /DNA_END=1037 /DNA_ORIENTATION=+ /assembly_acc=CAM_ASM_000155